MTTETDAIPEEQDLEDAPTESEKEEGPSIPETIQLKHKFFSVSDEIYFRAGEHEDEFFMVTPIEDQIVELSLSGIKRELKLKNNSHDGFMLSMVEKSLRFVQRIAIGDKIPTELLSGKASWEVTDEHRAVAQKRLTMQLVTWLLGEEEVFTDIEQLNMVADDPNNKAKINDAFESAAKELGVPVDEKEKIIDLVNEFAEELAYIEALRGQFLRLLVIQHRFKDLTDIYLNDNRMSEEVGRVTTLCEGAFDAFREDFKSIDYHTKNIIDVLKLMPEKIKIVRKFRDDMHSRFWAWRDLIEEWELTPAGRSVTVEKLIQVTYQFLAQRFLAQDEWSLFSKSQENTLKSGNESIW